MKKAVIFHGTLGSPAENWFPWLERELKNLGLQVWVPQLPGAERPSLREWHEFVRGNCPFAIDSGTLVVGHSSGASLALVVAQNNAAAVGAVACVAVVRDNDRLKWEPLNRLFDVAYDYDAIRAKARKLVLVHSDNDPYIPLDEAKSVAERSGAEIVVLSGQGHFSLNSDARYREFPELLEILKKRDMV